MAMPAIAASLAPAFVLAALAGPIPASAAIAGGRPGDPWLDRVRAFTPGALSGFGAADLPRIVLGPPEGFGAEAGSTDVVSLGMSGTIVVSFDDNAVVDGPGDDLVIFENSFHAGSVGGPLFTEYALVEVSADGKHWHAFPYDAETGEGLAGIEPVFASSMNAIDPLALEGGGDRFDIGQLGLDVVRLVRLTDAGEEIDDYGNHSFAGTKGGFDLDAAAALHSTPLARVTGSVLQQGMPVAGVRVRLRGEGETRWRRRRTRANGTFRFARLVPGRSYEVQVAPDGAGPTETIEMDIGQMRAHVDFVLP